MLRKIRIQNGFTHKDSTFEFQAGHTVIVGKNGRGKSLIGEFAQYALWGSSALRGEADDYKKLIVDLWLDVRGKSLHVHRSGKAVTVGEIIPSGHEIAIASGTRPVNAAIGKIFGYSFDVFKVANAANQGAVAALSNMKPAERKRMVDETIGLNVIDLLEKFIADQLKDLRPRLGVKLEGHVAPVEPVKPENYRDLREVDAELAAARKQLTTLEILQAQANAEIAMPVPPEVQTFEHDIEELERQEGHYQRDVAERASARAALAKLPPVREEVFLHPEDEKLEQLYEEQRRENEIQTARYTLLRSIGDTPRTFPHTVEQLETRIAASEEANTLLSRWQAKQRLLAAQQLNHCPSCDHEWHTPDPRLADYLDVPEECPVGGEGTESLKKDLATARKVEAAAASYTHLDALVPTGVDHKLLIGSIETMRQARSIYEASLGYEEAREDYTVRLARPEKTSVKKQIDTQRAYAEAVQRYERDVERASADMGKRDVARQAVETFDKNLPVKVGMLEAQARAILVYEQQHAHYSVAVRDYDDRKAEIAALEGEIEEWTAARGAMADVRTAVKGYLLPSLNKVASSLLAQMTGGELNYVHVNEDFEITIDGLGIDKLSGAGKDVSNLALRLGLGTVLTNQTFSTLLLDEIDAGCDDERALYISNCLSNLTKTFKQVIVVSHKKDLIADHRIEL